MAKIDERIIEICTNISSNIDKLSEDVGLLSQNILGQLRNLVETVISKIYLRDRSLSDLDVSYTNTIGPGISYISGIQKYKILRDFHNSLQISVSHYTLDSNNAERLVLKYLEELIKLRTFIKSEFDLDVLQYLSLFPRNRNADLYEYYSMISEKLEIIGGGSKDNDYNDRYYVLKKKPFFIKGKIYYELTVIEATDKNSKFDRFVLYTKIDINDYYAIKVKVRKDNIFCNGLHIPIVIVADFEVAIRPCEIDNYCKIFGIQVKTNAANKDYQFLMKFLGASGYSLLDIVNFEQIRFANFLKDIESIAKSKGIINLLVESRKIITVDKNGSNILRYLLLNLNNRTIKNQSRGATNNNLLSNLQLHNGCIPFEEMPFCTSPLGQNPSLTSLFDAFNPNEREHELLARFIMMKTERDKQIYTDIKELVQFSNVDQLIDRYNNLLYVNPRHQLRRIEKYGNKVFILEYDESVSSTLKQLIRLTDEGVSNYANSVTSWLQETKYNIDSAEKKKGVVEAFASSKLFAVYGSAGTGKTTMLNHFANFFAGRKKIFLTNTYAALENLKRRITVTNSSFISVKKFLNQLDKTYDVIFIDECSTISNSDINRILSLSTFKLLILAGDIFQIQSISFGNWFELARRFIPNDSYIELMVPFRTTNQELLNLWQKVRECDSNILEFMSKGKYSYPINNELLTSESTNEIILCLNYDGLYGINNVNRVLQQRNSNKGFMIGVKEYKIGDPILFNENSERFSPLLFNNAKGIIHNFKEEVGSVIVQIELDKSINEFDLVDGVELVGQSKNNNSIIEFVISKYITSDNDDIESTIPFNIAYAVSIHKSQGLEYDSVKIIIVDEIEELITHNIFYTAITRTKNLLKIYWSPETQKKILSSFVGTNKNSDIHIITQKHSLEIK